MANWNKQIRDSFAFSKIEQRGIAVLIAILIVLILVNVFLPRFVSQQRVDFSEYQNEIEAFENRIQKTQDSINENRKTNKYSSSDISHLNPFEFDPNQLPVEVWKNLGLNDKQIETIKNFERSGGKFRKKEDLAKIYTISNEEYEVLEPFIVIRKQESEKIEDKQSYVANITPFRFDPNKMTMEMGDSLGLRERTINAIVNYRNSGGAFLTKDDLKKIYTISDTEYELLEPFIFITQDSTIISLKMDDNSLISIGINTADTLDLQQLKGIGPSFARRIIKYRIMLGGYYSTKQLLEVYGMDSIRFSGIKDHITLEDLSIKRININNATIKEMIKHPYIEFYLAKSIITYRSEIGSFTDVSQIKNAKLIYEELYQKIAPYLTIEDTK